MGIVHFAPVGVSPGAVTSALSYLHKNPSVLGNYEGAVIQDLVVFCSHDVHDGRTSSDEYISNHYGTRQPRRSERSRRREPQTVQEVIVQHLKDQGLRKVMDDNRGKLYFWPVAVDDFGACFETLAKATLALGKADGTGRLLYANITGGTNVLNAALHQVASLSGLFGKLYYTFVRQAEDRRFLLPPSDNTDEYDLRLIPHLKTQNDEQYYRVLEVMGEKEGWCPGEEVLKKLKEQEYSWPQERHYFSGMDFQRFKRQFLNRMDGREIKRSTRPGPKGPEKGDENCLDTAGLEILQRLEDPYFRALVYRGKEIDPDLQQACQQELEQHRYQEDT